MVDIKSNNLGTPYTPMLLIGLGGSGINAVRTIQFYADKPDIGPALDPSLHKMTQNNMVCSIGIDTDGHEFDVKRINPDIYPAHIAQYITKGREYPKLEHTVHIEKFNLNENIKMAREYARQRLAEPAPRFEGNSHIHHKTDDQIMGQFFYNILNISDELYDRLLPSGREVNEGAGQLRLLGRMAFFSGLQGIHQALAMAHDRLGEASGPYMNNLRISIFCSLAGGTGSGMFMDLAILLRKKFFNSALISGYFLLPEIFSNHSQADRIWANSYAALRELTTLARNFQDEPIHIPYHYSSSESTYKLQKGDSAIFDEIFLFDESAGWIDRNVEGGLREGSIQAAGRFMADAALARGRRDIMANAKSLQNVHISSEKGGAHARQVFNAIGAAHLQPLEIYGLADIALRHNVSSHVIEHFCEEYAPTLYPTNSSNNDLADFFTLYDNLVKKIHHYIQEHFEKIKFDPQEKKKTISPESKNQLHILEMRGYKDAEKFYTEYRDILDNEMERDSILIRDEIISHFDKLASRAENPETLKIDNKGRIIFTDLLTSTRFFHEIISTSSKEALQQLDEIFKGLQNSGLPLQKDMHTRFVELRSDIDKHKKSAGNELNYLRLPVPQAAFRLRTVLDGYKGKQRQERSEDLQESGVEDLAKNTIEFIAELSDVVQEIYNASGYINASTDQVKKLVDSVLAGDLADEFLHRLDSIIELSQDSKNAVDRIKDKIDQHVRDIAKIPELDGEENRYESLMEPVDKTLQRFWEREESTNKQAESEKDILVSALEKSLWANMREKDGTSSKRGRDILTKLRNRKPVSETENKTPHLDAISMIAYETFFKPVKATDYIKDDKKHAEELIKKIDGSHKFFQGVIEFLFSQPSFELARLGGEGRIRHLAKICKLALFSPDPSPGQLNYRYGIVAMPDNIKVSQGASAAAETKIAKDIRAMIEHELNIPVSLTNERSDIPIIYTEKRYYSAYQIKSLRKYYDHYMEVEQERRVLYHTIQEAVDFPHLLSDLAVVDSTKMRQPWICYAHEEGDREISPDNQHCPLCRYEYEQGKRRYIDITYRKKKPDLLPVPGLNRNIPKKFIDYFFNGIPYSIQGEWTRQEGHSGSSFQRLLREREYYEPIHRGFKGSKQATFIFPAIPISPTNPNWHWVWRKDGKSEERFQHPFTQKPLYECYHCSFPIVYNAKDARHSYDCPRCQRSLYHCDVCSEKEGMLFEPKKDIIVQEDRCPRCDNLMHMHSAEGGCTSSSDAGADDEERKSNQ